jgi:hypothetical protein
MYDRIPLSDEHFDLNDDLDEDLFDHDDEEATDLSSIARRSLDFSLEPEREYEPDVFAVLDDPDPIDDEIGDDEDDSDEDGNG